MVTISLLHITFKEQVFFFLRCKWMTKRLLWHRAAVEAWHLSLKVSECCLWVMGLDALRGSFCVSAHSVLHEPPPFIALSFSSVLQRGFVLSSNLSSNITCLLYNQCAEYFKKWMTVLLLGFLKLTAKLPVFILQMQILLYFKHCKHTCSKHPFILFYDC